MMENLKAATLK